LLPKAIPLRSCLGCREVRPKDELLRFVLDPERTLFPDISRKLPGRGSYTCFRVDCLEAALKKKQFNRSFKGEVKLLPGAELLALIIKILEEKINSLFALANKAGKAVSGSDKVMDTLRRGDAAILILAADISGESKAKFLAVAERAGVETFMFSMKDRLGGPLGKEIRTAIAVLKGSFAVTLRSDLKRYGNFFEGGAK
jgi:predicted RNA-binding protein YlxR (DUF448 family)